MKIENTMFNLEYINNNFLLIITLQNNYIKPRKCQYIDVYVHDFEATWNYRIKEKKLDAAKPNL